MSYKKFLSVVFCMLTLFTAVKSVAAETTIPDGMLIANSCSKNLYKPTTLENFETVSYDFSNKQFISFESSQSPYYYYSNILIPAKPNTTYYFNKSSSCSTVNVYMLNSNLEYIIYSTGANSTSSNFEFNCIYGSSFTTPDDSNIAYFEFWLYKTKISSFSTASDIMLFEGDTSTDYVDYEECPVIEPDPEPDTPSEDNTSETITIDYSISYVIAILLSSMFLYKFLEPLFSRKG